MRKPLIATAIFAALTAAAVPPASAADEPELVSKDSQHAAISDGGSTAAYLYTDTASGGAQSIRRTAVGDPDHVTMDQPIPDGKQSQFDMSANGERVAITTADADGTNPSLKVRNVWNSTTWTLPGTFTAISRPRISTDGRFTAFAGTDAATGRTNAYRFDIVTRTVAQLTSGNGVSNVVISGDGHTTAYATGNHTWVRRGTTGAKKQADVNPRGQSYGGNSRPYALSDTGNYVLFASTSTREGRTQCAVTRGCLYRANLASYDVRPASFDFNQLEPISGVLDTYAADLSGNGRVAVWADDEDSSAAHVYRFTTGGENVVSTNTDADKSVTDVTIDRDGGYVAYSTTVSSVDDLPSVWRTPSGI